MFSNTYVYCMVKTFYNGYKNPAKDIDTYSYFTEYKKTQLLVANLSLQC